MPMDFERRMQIIRSILPCIPEDPNEKMDVALLAGIASCSVGEMVEALIQTQKVVQHGDHYFTPHQVVVDYDADNPFADIYRRESHDTAAQHRHQPPDDESRWGDD